MLLRLSSKASCAFRRGGVKDFRVLVIGERDFRWGNVQTSYKF